MVVEDRLQALRPLATLIDKRVTQPHPCAQVEQMGGRDPRLRQPLRHQQLAQMAGVGAVGLCALLVSPQRARLGRLGQMRHSTDRGELLDHEPPARGGLQSNLELPAPKPGKEPPHRLPVRRRDTCACDLAGRRVKPLRHDLRPVLIKPHHDHPSDRRPRVLQRHTV